MPSDQKRIVRTLPSHILWQFQVNWPGNNINATCAMTGALSKLENLLDKRLSSSVISQKETLMN